MQTLQLAKDSVSLAHVATEDRNDVKFVKVNLSHVPLCRSRFSLYFVFVNRSVATTRSLEDSQEMDPCVFFWVVFFVVYISLPRFKRG